MVEMEFLATNAQLIFHRYHTEHQVTKSLCTAPVRN